MVRAMWLVGLCCAMGSTSLGWAAPTSRPVVKRQARQKRNAPQKRLSARDMLRFRWIRQMSMSPDGKHIAYITSKADAKKNRWRSSLWVASRVGKRWLRRRFTHGRKGVWSLVWSPDSKRVAFVSRRGKRPQLWVIPVDGGEAWQATRSQTGVGQPTWRSDGRALFYLAGRIATKGQKRARRRRDDAVQAGESRRNRCLWRQSLNASGLPSGKPVCLTSPSFNVVSYAPSPTGRGFAAVISPQHRFYHILTDSRVVRLTKDGRIALTYLRKRSYFQSLTWSPDGKMLAFLATQGAQPSLMGRLMLLSADGKVKRDLAKGLDYTLMKARFAPDGKGVWVHRFAGVMSRLTWFPVAGKQPRRELIQGRLTIHGPPSLSADGKRIAMLTSTPMKPVQIVVSDASAWKPIPILQSNPWLQKYALGYPQRLRWKSGDGQQIEGILIRPRHAGATPPLMVMPHGGPDWLDRWGFSSWTQYFASQGFQVLKVNFRGSLGYGFQFFSGNRGRICDIDYQDLISGVRHLIARKLANPKQMVIGGWSFGGTMTNWTIGHTRMFRAAVSGAGVSDTYSRYGISDINHSKLAMWEFGGNPYQHPAKFERAAPVRFLHRAKTPTLILHGKRDHRVPVGQSMQLHRGLKTVGVPTRLVLYPREGHSIREPRHMVDMFTRWVRWYRRFLGPQVGVKQRTALKGWSLLMHKAHLSKQPFPRLSAEASSHSYQSAYFAQGAVVKRWQQRIRGYKIGLSSKAGRHRFGVPHPLWGQLLPGMILPLSTKGQTVVRRSTHRKMFVELEIGFRLSRDVHLPVHKASHMRRFVDRVFAAVELPDIAFKAAKARLQGVDLVAANVGARQVLIGPMKPAHRFSLSGLKVWLQRDGKRIVTGKGSDALGDPWEALRWLVNDVLKRKGSLKAGHIVITGALGKRVLAKPGAHTASFGPLGTYRFAVK